MFTGAYGDTTTWAKTYGGSEHEEGLSVELTSDGGYIVAGVTDTFDVGGFDVWILKLDSDGNVEWEKAYGGSDLDFPRAVQQTSDGGYIVAGQTETFGSVPDAAWILKLDPSGNIEWEKAYSVFATAFDVEQTLDGGYVAIGANAFSVLKLNSNGDVEWHKSYGESEFDHAQSIEQTSDGGYIVAGGSIFGDAKVLKLDSDGNVEWEKEYGEDTTHDGANAIQQTSDGGYIVAGSTNSFGVESSDFWVLKLDSDGNVEWEKAYGGADFDEGGSIQQSSDGGYVMVGRTDSFGPSVLPDLWIIKLDSDGNVEWEKAYGGDGNDDSFSIRQTPDDGYVVAGRTESFGDLFSADTWVLKLDSDGEIQNCGADFIQETSATVTDTSSTPRDISLDVVDVDSSGEDTSATVKDSTALVKSQCGDYEFLLLENGSIPSDGIVDWGHELVAAAATTDESVGQVEFRWINPTGEVVREFTSAISGSTQDTFSPNDGGRWSVEADFLNGIVITKTFEISFFVVPESPIGAIAIVVSGLAVLGLFSRLRSKNHP